jgi:hypothetical protein
MLFVSILTSDRSRDPELWATIWQGESPPGITIIGAYNLANNKRVFIWDGKSSADLQFMDRFNQVGVLETYPAFDRTVGWQLAFAKDLDAFAKQLLERAGPFRERVERMIELRRRGVNAPNPHAARAAARQWQEEEAQEVIG